MGGARSDTGKAFGPHCGSSPRGRGTARPISCCRQSWRFIPAWAGHGLTDWPSMPRYPVHPRVGGARSVRKDGDHAQAVHPRVGGARLTYRRGASRLNGSSPRGRGTVKGMDALQHHIRFIPAWAGHGHKARGTSRPLSVHPRVGGARQCRHSDEWRGSGSSPRGRGTVNCTKPKFARNRFIPAWAGHGSLIVALPAPSSVHPRVGGART